MKQLMLLRVVLLNAACGLRRRLRIAGLLALSFPLAAHPGYLSWYAQREPRAAWLVTDEEVERAILSVPPHYTGISRIGQASAQTTSATFSTAPSAGDLLLVFAHRDGSTTAPTLATGYTSIDSSGANTNSARLAYRWSDGTETTTGTWTNATSVAGIVLRGAHFVGAFAAGGGASTTLSFTGITLQDTGSRSWVIGFAGHRTATNVGTNAPTGLTTESSTTDVAVFSSEGVKTSWTTQTASVNTNSGWRTYVVEVRDQVAQTTGAGIPVLSGWRQTNSQGDTGAAGAKTFRVPWIRPTLSGNTYTLFFCATTGAGVTVTSVKDSAGNALNQRMLDTSFTSGTGNTYGIYDILNASAGLAYAEVTVSGPLAGNFVAATMELYNVATSSAVDGTPTVAETGSGTAHQPGAITTTAANSAVLSFQIYNGATPWNSVGNGPAFQVSPGEGATLLGADFCFGTCCQWQLKATAGSVNPQFYLTSDVGVATMAIAYKAATAGTAPTGIRVFGWQDFDIKGSPTPFTAQFPCQGDLVVINWCGLSGTNGLTQHLTAKDTRGNTWTSRTSSDFASSQNSQQYVDTDAAALKPSQGMILTGTLERADGGSCASFIDIIGSAAPGSFDQVSNANGTENTSNTWNVLTGLVPGRANCLVLLNEDQAQGTIQTCTGGANFISQCVLETTAQSGGTFGNGFMNDRGLGWGAPASTASITMTCTNDNRSGLAGVWQNSAAVYLAPAGGAFDPSTGFPWQPTESPFPVRRAVVSY